MSSPIKITFGELMSTSQQITSGAKQVEQQLNDLQAEVKRVLGAWDGSSSAAYNEAQDKWNTAAADLQAVLASIGSATMQAAEAYKQAEEQNARRW
ncbi:WXG100 family type VII secretion target [Lentzea sp. NPDC005914]|uniref:WXG100 family type VII secretion target n=1 Tax=Lentzea sp. NPDC005914 TaxID=3154572 RepID=UPI0033ED1246